MRDDGAVDGAREVGGDAADDDAVGPRGGAGVGGAGGEDGEFEVGGLCVGEGEALVVVVGVWWGEGLIRGREGGLSQGRGCGMRARWLRDAATGG